MTLLTDFRPLRSAPPTVGLPPGLRHPLLSILLATLLPVAGNVAAQSTVDVFEHDWQGVTSARTLADGSVLTEFRAGRAARGNDQARLDVTFSPRFGCSPVPRLVLAAELAERLDAREGMLLSIRIDDEPVVWPLLLDRGNDDLLLSYAGNERERTTLRLQIDIGEFAVLDVDDELSLTFSLLGSRRSLAAVESLCLEHEAIAWDGV